MSLDTIALWGFVATLVMTVVLTAARYLRITRLSIPLILGTMVSADWDRAERAGIGIHLVLGWLLSLLYAAAFEDLRQATWWLGAALGVLHGLVLLVVGMSVLPHMHPRMSPEIQEPSDMPMLEPPGFLALHYGRSTPIVTLLAHALYGAILGALYRP